MKTKYLLLVIFALITTIGTCANAPNKNQDSIYWEFIKERLFRQDFPMVASFKDDILIKLYGASRQDSLVIDALIHELTPLISNRKIGYAGEEWDPGKLAIAIGFNVSYHISPNEDLKHSPIVNGNQILFTGLKGIPIKDGLRIQNIIIKLNGTISFSERKRYIDYALLRSLCVITGDPREARTFIDHAVYNGFDYDPANTVFTDADKFLIKKLYSNNFQHQFKKFMLETYSRRIYLLTIRSEYMKVMGYAFAIIFALILFCVSYYLVLRRKFKTIYLGYILPALYVAISFELVRAVYRFFASPVGIVQSTIIFIIILSLLVFVIATLLYFLEGWLIKPNMSFATKLITKVLLTLFLFIGFFGIFSFAADTSYNAFIPLCYLFLILALGRGTLLFIKGVSESLIREKDVELSTLRELKARAEIDSLHARINPHFLYNSLNSIAGLAHRDPDKTEKMALSLSDLFRYTVNRTGEQQSSIREEVAMVQAYLEIEQIRFGDRMSFTIELDKELESQMIPKFILQPLVENAIKHGISVIEGKGEIVLSIRRTDEGMVVEVADNGPDFVEGLVSGYGLQSLYDQLKISYGDKAELNWQNTPKKMMSVLIKTTMQPETK